MNSIYTSTRVLVRLGFRVATLRTKPPGKPPILLATSGTKSVPLDCSRTVPLPGKRMYDPHHTGCSVSFTSRHGHPVKNYFALVPINIRTHMPRGKLSRSPYSLAMAHHLQKNFSLVLATKGKNDHSSSLLYSHSPNYGAFLTSFSAYLSLL